MSRTTTYRTRWDWTCDNCSAARTTETDSEVTRPVLPEGWAHLPMTLLFTEDAVVCSRECAHVLVDRVVQEAFSIKALTA